MKMDKETSINVEAVAPSTTSIKHSGGKWSKVVGKAADFFDRINKGPATARFNESGECVFIRQEPVDAQKPSNKPNFYEDRSNHISRHGALNTSLELLKNAGFEGVLGEWMVEAEKIAETWVLPFVNKKQVESDVVEEHLEGENE